ncbi:uncharacterized protein BXZ73DRAFT_104004 [Epithele typhae]|uniref:uncharacterized protein n=1 Tax=Epithele typhae TaxID=378194 RepID=UPI00200728EB|nr:uncharacterized protein BXZ73DRAFT_104004 [Epithele typhae]KAH9922771.1 hypothetical protein BXZ73DRAFT_104004 [Epithele typhae]
MPSTSNTPAVPRPIVKRACHTWPGHGPIQPLSHFEDFLRRLAPRPSSQASAASLAQLDKARAPSQEPIKAAAGPSLRPESRSRTMSCSKMSGFPLKSPAASIIDLGTHEAALQAPRGYFSARESLLNCMGVVPEPPLSTISTVEPEERRSRALTRAFHDPRHAPAPAPRPLLRSRSTRRSSSRSSVDSLATASSSEAPATPKSASLVGLDEARVGEHRDRSSPSPSASVAALEEIERTSRFSKPSVCTGCKRAGANYPTCARCGDDWCSRACRTGATHGCLAAPAPAPAAVVRA